MTAGKQQTDTMSNLQCKTEQMSDMVLKKAGNDSIVALQEYSKCSAS